MARLTKEQYEYRRESAARRMAKNAKIESLSDDQHELLSEICRMRHEIHCNQISLYNSESGNYGMYIDWLNCPDNSINRKLSEANLPLIKWSVSLNDLPSDYDRYYSIIDDTDEADEKNKFKFFEQINQINSDIENYLRAIDEQHGTDYAPSGALRII